MADEQLLIALEARINDFEKNMKRAEGTGTRTYQNLRRGSRSATRQMEQDMARSAGSIRQSVASVTGSIGSMGKALAGGFLGGVAIGGAAELIGSSREIVKGMAEIGDEAKRAGMSAQAFQEWKFVADQNRISVDALVDGFKELSLRADEFITTGAGSGAEAFARLGLRADDLKKRLKDPSALMLEIMKRMEGMDRAAQIRIADEIFGGTGGEQFVQLLGQGEDALRDTIARAHETGAVFEDELIAKAQDLDRRFRELQTTAGNFFKRVVVGAAEAVAELADMRAKLDEVFPDKTKGRAALGDELYDTLNQNRDVVDQHAQELAILEGQYQSLGEQAALAGNTIRSAIGQLDSWGYAEQADDLRRLVAEQDELVRAFRDGEMTGEDFSTRLQEIQARAVAAFDELEAGDRVQFGGVIAQLERLGGVIGGIIGMAARMKAALASAAGVTAGQKNLDAMRQRQAAEKASMDSAAALAEANDKFTASETARNTATKEQVALEREMADVRKRAQQMGATLTEDEVQGFATAALAGDAARSAAGKGGGRGKGSARAKGGRGAAGRQDEFTRGVEQIRAQTAALEAEALVMAAVATSGQDYGDALEYARKKADLLHAAQQEGKEITPELEAEIDGLAQAYVTAGLNAEQAAEKLRTIQDQSQRGKAALQDMFGAIIDGSMSGKEAFAQLLAEIGKVQFMKRVMGLLDVFTGGSGVFKGLGNLLSYDGGGYTGNGARTGGLDGKGGRLAMVHPRETITDHTKGQQTPAAAPDATKVQVGVTVDETGNLQAYVKSISQSAAGAAVKAYDRNLPNRMRQVGANLRKIG